MKINRNKYDVVVIGSGIGGSTAALLLSKYFNKKVAILEKHWTFGGLTHEFEFDGKKFATGVHYIGAVNNQSVPDKVFNILTGGELRWIKMPDKYDEVIFPGYSFAIPSNEEDFISELSKKYPNDRKALKSFVRHSKIAFRFLAFYMSFRSFAPKIMHWIIPIVKATLRFDPNSSLKDYLEKRFSSTELRNILSARWCDYGVIPEEASFMANSMIFNHYLNGAFYPEKGVSALVSNIKRELDRNNVDILLSHEVKSIITKDDTAMGVEVLHPDNEHEIILADKIISNVGAPATYQKLLRKKKFDFIVEDYDKLSAPYDFFTIYISLKKSPQVLGFDGSNKWIFNTSDQSKLIIHPKDKNYPAFYCLLFPSLKAKDSINHTMEILTMVNYQSFEKWKSQEWKKRDSDYYAFKNEIIRKIFADIEKRYPGFNDIVSAYDSSTPLTTEKFISRNQGSSYGIPSTTKRYHLKWLSNKTPIRNLLLSGQDTIGPGVMGAMMGGVSAAALSLGRGGYMKLMRHVRSHTMNADDKLIKYYPIIVKERITENSNTVTFKFENSHKMQYEAGQFIILNAFIDDEYYKRAYSLSSYPDEENLSITIKRVENGLVSNYMIEQIHEGDTLFISEPKGDLVIKENDMDKDILFIAAGSGITPIYSLIKDTLENQIYNRLHLLYSNKAPEKTIFKKDLDHLLKRYKRYFNINYHFSEFSADKQNINRLTDNDIEQAIASFDINNLLIFVCAPESLVRSAWRISKSMGLSLKNFHYESFTTKMINLTDHAVPNHDAYLVFNSNDSRYETQINGGDSVLEGMIKNQIPIDYSCMSGDCGLCKCKIVAGETCSIKKETVSISIKDDDILPCISYAKSKELELESLG